MLILGTRIYRQRFCREKKEKGVGVSQETPEIITGSPVGAFLRRDRCMSQDNVSGFLVETVQHAKEKAEKEKEKAEKEKEQSRGFKVGDQG